LCGLCSSTRLSSGLRSRQTQILYDTGGLQVWRPSRLSASLAVESPVSFLCQQGRGTSCHSKNPTPPETFHTFLLGTVSNRAPHKGEDRRRGESGGSTMIAWVSVLNHSGRGVTHTSPFSPNQYKKCAAMRRGDMAQRRSEDCDFFFSLCRSLPHEARWCSRSVLSPCQVRAGTVL